MRKVSLCPTCRKCEPLPGEVIEQCREYELMEKNLTDLNNLPDFIIRNNTMYRLRITKNKDIWELAYYAISWGAHIVVKGKDLMNVMAEASEKLCE